MDPTTLFHKRIARYDAVFPDLRKHLARNPRITMDMVLQDIERNPSRRDEWTFDMLCINIPVDTLLAHGFSPINTDLVSYLSLMTKITMETLIRTKDSVPWNWQMLTYHKSITVEDIVAHPELPWSYPHLVYNPKLTLSHVLQYPHLFPEPHNVFRELGRKATFQDILDHPDKPWLVNVLSSPNIKTKEHVLYLIRERFSDHTDKPMLKMYTCMNPNLTFQDLIDLFGLDILDWAAYNPNVTFDDFEKYPLWFWGSIPELADRLPLDYILQHPEMNWDWENVIDRNKTLTYEAYPKLVQVLTTHIETKCDYTPTEYHLKHLCFYNKHLSLLDRKRFYEDLINLIPHTGPRDYKHLPYDFIMTSPFFLEPTFEEIRQYFAGKKIVRHVVHALTDPAYLQCRKRLQREYGEMT